MRRTWQLAGSYILNQRMVPDWWHTYYREDAHAHAKDTLLAAMRRDEEDDAAETIGSVQDGVREGREAGHLHSGEREGSANGLRRTHSLSLYDVNALVATFTSNRDVTELSTALQYLRERLQQPLAPYHYHSLFRVFNHNLDKNNAVQLLDVVAQRGETTLETYARAVDCVHCLAPSDSLPRILAIVQAAQEGFGTLVMFEESGSEGATVAAFGCGAERQAAKEDPDRLPGPRPEESANETEGEGAPGVVSSSSSLVSSPVLTALLHHLATSGSSGCDPVAVALVAVWIRALGVRLSDWDCVHAVSCLLCQVEEFPRVRSLLGSFPAFPVGSASPNAVWQRLEDCGELASQSSASVLPQIVAAMKRSLGDAGVDVNVAVDTGLVNTRTTSLRTTLQFALDRFYNNYPGKGYAGLGCHGYNPALLFHAVSIIHSALRDNTEAARLFMCAAEAQETQRRHREQRHELMQQGGKESDNEDALGDNAEAFAIGHQYLMDIGSLLPSLTMRTREDIREVFTRLVRRMTLAERESQLQETLSDSGRGSTNRGFSSLPLSTESSAAPPLRPTTADMVGVEGYVLGFTRTYEEAAAALQVAVSRVDRAKARLPRETRLAFKQLAQYCCDHPLTNPKLTPTGLAERQKWGAYLDARDTALSLFGSAKQARDVMKHLYYHDNVLPALRSDAVIARDFQDALKVFFRRAADAGASSTEGAGSEGVPSLFRAGFESPPPPGGDTIDAFTAHRTSAPHIRCSPCAVPPHLYDPAVFNVYPHVMLRKGPVGVKQLEDEAAALKGDMFAELWRTLMNPSIMGNDPWYLRNTDMYLLLMRCLLHRLDWEAAAHLTSKMLEHSSYTYLMDHELTIVFREIGDPAGCLAFKVATKLFDGRITRDGQTKRERFHQEQFRS